MPPTGTVTFLLTDIEGSTQLWESEPDAMADAVEWHDRLVRDAVTENGGYVFTTAGDSFAVAFGRTTDAVHAAELIQRRLDDSPRAATCQIRVRAGLHTGEAEEREGDYFGSTVNLAARIMSAAHGGQTLMSNVVAGLVPGMEVLDLGSHLLKDVREPVSLLQLGSGDFPPLRTVEQLGSGLRRRATPLVGRDAEVSRISALLPDRRVVTLVGPGGVGKTRLAVEVAIDAAAHFAHGARLVELEAAADDASGHHAIAAAVGARS